MPNWAFGVVNAKGSKESLRAFIGLILEQDQTGNDKQRYLAGTWLTDTLESVIEQLTTKDLESQGIEFGVQFKWSAKYCLIDGYPNEKQCPSIGEVCKKFDIRVVIDSEQGESFSEHLVSDKDGTTCECYDMTPHICNKCQCEFSVPYDAVEPECTECASKDISILIEEKENTNEEGEKEEEFNNAKEEE